MSKSTSYLFLSAVILVLLLGFLGKLYQNNSLREENEVLRQQLGQAKAEAKDNIGKPTNVHNLPDGNYLRSENGHYGFVQMNVDHPVGPKGPHIAVWHSEDIPGGFRVKNGDVQPQEILK